MMREYVNQMDGLWGLMVGDALGVPAEFKDREMLRRMPVMMMTGFGTHWQEVGTWSDDTSMTLATMNSLCRSLDYENGEDVYLTASLRQYRRMKKMSECKQLEEKEIRSTGFVVHTLEAAVWCLLTTNSFKECVLKAVNLGGDTDTVAAVAGSLAGYVYGQGGDDGIPQEWIRQLSRFEWLEGKVEKFYKTLDV